MQNRKENARQVSIHSNQSLKDSQEIPPETFPAEPSSGKYPAQDKGLLSLESQYNSLPQVFVVGVMLALSRNRYRLNRPPKVN